ncbi:MAG TPA: beta-L-arabinofuranosidase domain-containing protein [Micromonosporaceae bacterium]
MTGPNTIKGPVSPTVTGRLTLHPLGLDRVGVTGGFFGDWQRRSREVTTPHALEWLERDGSVDNLRRARDAMTAGSAAHRGMWFSDSDVYKVLEALSWEIGRSGAAELDGPAAELIAVVRAAQEPDGYVNSYVQAGFDARWDNLVMSHELYCMGHLIQAGVAHKRSTGRDDLLDVARSAADCLVRDFGEHRRKDTDGHPIVEAALVELYRETGERAYLDLALQLVNVRGYGVLKPKRHFDSPYYQDATPIREQTTVVGHAVRALYLLAGVVDVYVETGDASLLDSALRQWTSMAATKLYLTGAVGSRFEGESFGDEYELPPDLVYGETCATVASVMTAWRLLLVTGEARFADAIERALFNVLAASTSVHGDAFFYNNPAQRRAPHTPAVPGQREQRSEAPGTRPTWLECACCPPNIMRTIASFGAYVATHTPAGVQIHQYAAVAIDADLASGGVRLEVKTAYPLDGTVDIDVVATGEDEWTLSLRVPGWCRDAAVRVNGTPVAVAPDGYGYLRICRRWTPGDTISYVMPMRARLTVAHPAVDAVRGMVAVERGPMVYCFEGPDQAADVDLNRVEVLLDRPMVETYEPDLLGRPGVTVRVAAVARDDSAWEQRGWSPLGERPVSTGREIELVAVPYYLWANRGASTMRVFTPAWSAAAAGA